MKTSSKGRTLIKKFESLQLVAYRDSVGVLTIGYGHTHGVQWGDTVTTIEAEDLLTADLANVEKTLASAVHVPLNQNQYDALASFIFNLGPGNFNSSTLLKKLNNGDYQGAADEIPRWNRAGGKELRGLTRRRAAERELFLS
ncbi:lysozyme [Serratia marcescens]|uniref:lysozyme n=1 Tax=Serratia marcescens TaxID=615 RepID=UPI000D8C150A|nr:lysozyme [Serratia marcescens]MDS0828893.1 lysozyme [Serratia marcescens]PYA06493.1 lysozyme [Serratia marcescens]